MLAFVFSQSASNYKLPNCNERFLLTYNHHNLNKWNIRTCSQIHLVKMTPRTITKVLAILNSTIVILVLISGAKDNDYDHNHNFHP